MKVIIAGAAPLAALAAPLSGIGRVVAAIFMTGAPLGPMRRLSQTGPTFKTLIAYPAYDCPQGRDDGQQ